MTNGNLGTHLCGFCSAETSADEPHTDECLKSRQQKGTSMRHNETKDQTIARLLDRHLTTATQHLTSKEYTANRADPTAVKVTQGWVTFLYDPWLTLDDPEANGHPEMGTTYAFNMTESWGAEITLWKVGELGLGSTYDQRIYVDGMFPEADELKELDKLLDGHFLKDQPDLDWIAAGYDEPANQNL